MAVPAATNPARGTPDTDDYACGFGIWSGSSFAAPACAGQVAARLAAAEVERADADARAALAVEAVDAVLAEEAS
jgi:hypothetical protein